MNFSVRQPVHLFCRFDTKEFVDIGAMLQGNARLLAQKRLLAISPSAGAEVEITHSELAVLAGVSRTEWTPDTEISQQLDADEEQLLRLAENGLLITDRPDEPYATLRERDQQLGEANWSPYSALHHFMSKWTARNLVSNTEGSKSSKLAQWGTERLSLKEMIRLRGLPPHHFYSRPDNVGTTNLPILSNSGRLYKILTERRTSRSFDPGRSLTLSNLSQILYYTFGCHGLAPLVTGEHEHSEHLVAIKKTSPSGGALTPVECYPLLTKVDGLDPGLYHYNVERHALDHLKPMTVNEAEALAEVFTAGQSYYRKAHALFVMTARFYRQFWKYDNHEKAYKVILMDAAHLSQTLYLLGAEMKLGTFITAAINDTRIEEELGVNPQKEGVLCIAGCGVVFPDSKDEISLKPRHYDPSIARRD